MTNEKLHKRIRNILALSMDKSTTEEERQAAYRLAQKLLLENNLTSTEIKESPFSSHTYFPLQNAGGPIWQRALLSDLGQINGVYVYTMTGEKGTFLYGRKDDITSLLSIAEFIMASILHEGLRQFGLRKNKLTTKHNFLKSFALGARSGYHNSIKSLESHSGYAIVANRYAEAKETLLNGRTAKTAKTKAKLDANATQTGYTYGQNLSSKRVETTMNRRLIGG
jgi:hypothetical protein